ncbi:hypothetical protein IT418_02630 [bacterium]|nr:hypothetical protein [bacterium]
MSDTVSIAPVILLDGLLASGSSIISNYVGQSYSFTVVNGNQYLRDLGASTGHVTAPVGTLKHEIQLLDFYELIAKENAAVQKQIYSFLTSKISIVKKPTIVHCTGYASYAFSIQLPVKHIYWLHATLDDRTERLLHRYKIMASKDQKQQVKERLNELDNLWEESLKSHLGINMREPEKQQETVIDTANMTTEQAFQKLATIESFIETYNSLASLMPDYHEEWRRWQCLVCQLVLESNKIVVTCPRCNNSDPDKFKDLD